MNIGALCSPPRSKLSTSSIAGEPRRGITANKRFALRDLMNRKEQRRSKLRGMNPVAIQQATEKVERGANLASASEASDIWDSLKRSFAK